MDKIYRSFSKRPIYQKFLISLAIAIDLGYIISQLAIYLEYDTFFIWDLPTAEITRTFLLTFGISTSSLFLAINLVDYQAYIFRNYQDIFQRKNLTLETIFDNDNRRTILEAILQEPGIHYSKLLEVSNLESGNLQWHLKKLLEFNLINEERVGNRKLYYSKMDVKSANPELELLLKSSVIQSIIAFLSTHPPCSITDIARALNSKKNTIKYNVDKLLHFEIVSGERVGNKLLLHLFGDPELIE